MVGPPTGVGPPTRLSHHPSPADLKGAKVKNPKCRVIVEYRRPTRTYRA